jgi:hypothetical protein
MKLETAQKLQWPWVTEKAFCLNDTGEYEVNYRQLKQAAS